MIELRVLSGSCVLEFVFLVERAVPAKRQVVYLQRQQILELPDLELSDARSDFSPVDGRWNTDAAYQCWYQRVAELLSKN
ncbi:hypothetical protein KFE80_01270 [bacterium SCSIO 12696]|nr:hypothetical protein KFE80_01270 [bacterium SCSIO 12696]